MATTYTPNYNLGKQENLSDLFDMSVITDDMDKRDTALGLKLNISDIIILTKDEYDALPDSKKTDGKYYLLKDVNSLEPYQPGTAFVPTPAQLDAMNSGITANDVTQIGVNTSNISNKIGASDYATQNTGGTVRIWTTTDGTSTTLHISNEAPTP